MTGSVHKDLLCNKGLDEIIERWRDCLLIREKKDDAQVFELTGAGSWHLRAMLEELEGCNGLARNLLFFSQLA
jgi:hypothetical protein